jgi:hypothetical protein
MCDRCIDLDEKIERCSRLLKVMTDNLASDGLQALLKSYLAEKIGLHPEER